MAKEVVDEILKLVEALRREGVEVDAVYLFGSWARGIGSMTAMLI